jgi:type I restriction enzyme S subunit
MTKILDHQDTFANIVEDIPKDWILTKNKYAFLKISNGKNVNEEADILSLTTNGIKVKENLAFGKTASSYKEHQLVKKGDIVFTPRDFDQTPILSDVSKFDGCISNLYIVDRVIKDFQPEFINYYWYGIKYLLDYFKNFSHGMRYSFNRYQFDEIPLLKPTFDEQNLIVNYLNDMEINIKKLIDLIEEKIKLTNELYVASINKYIYQGLNPEAEFKHTDNKLLGKIPKHWKISKLSNLGKFSKGKSITNNDLIDRGKPVILYSHIYTTYDRLCIEPKYFISNNKSKESTKIDKNTFLFTTSGETVDEIGKSILYSGENNINVGGDIALFKFDDENICDQNYFSFLFNSEICQMQKSLSSRGDIVVHIYEKQLRELVVPIPPLNEQKEIYEKLYLIEKNTKKLLKKYNQKIKILEELRKSTIAHVVTGKLRLFSDINE